MGWFELIPPVIGKGENTAFVILFHAIVAALVLIVYSTLSTLMSNTLHAPTPPIGWADRDYDADRIKRASLGEYMAANNLSPDSTPMNQFSVATANFGGIYTESIGLLRPWIGSASAEAARLQVEAGARAMVLDIWPDPANRQMPVVCAMLDTQSWSMQNQWMKWGLDKGVGRYSNWQLLTRNKAPLGEVVTTTLQTAFASNSVQNKDPFFLILKLHGAMDTAYLNFVGVTVQKAIGGNAMGPEWNKCLNQKSICTAPVAQFMSKVFVIVIPDIQPGYNSLPNVNTHSAFTTAFLTTRLGEITNALEQTPNTILFDPNGITAVSATGQANCANPTGPPQSLAQNGFCIVQPSIGGQTTDNTALFPQGYQACLQSGAQFVAVNLFSQNTADGPLTTFFDDKLFGKYSFRKI